MKKRAGTVDVCLATFSWVNVHIYKSYIVYSNSHVQVDRFSFSRPSLWVPHDEPFVFHSSSFCVAGKRHLGGVGGVVTTHTPHGSHPTHNTDTETDRKTLTLNRDDTNTYIVYSKDPTHVHKHTRKHTEKILRRADANLETPTTYRAGSTQKVRNHRRIDVQLQSVLHIHAVGAAVEQELGARVLI